MNLSLGQVMKAVVYFAAAFATVSPIFRHWQAGSINNGQPEGLIYVAIFGGVAVPLAWALLSFALIRDRRRDAAITALLLASLAVAQWYAGYLLVYEGIAGLWISSIQHALSTLAWLALVNFVLAAAITFLVRRLWRAFRAAGATRSGPGPRGLLGARL